MASREAQIIENILRRMEERHTTQLELAQASGIEKTALSKSLAGKRRLNLFELALIADVLELNVNDLLDHEQPVFALRADGRGAEIDDALGQCTAVIEDFLTFEALVGRR